jgi:hypothetical protein
MLAQKLMFEKSLSKVSHFGCVSSGITEVVVWKEVGGIAPETHDVPCSKRLSKITITSSLCGGSAYNGRVLV